MRKSSSTKEKITSFIKQAEAGMSIKEQRRNQNEDLGLTNTFALLRVEFRLGVSITSRNSRCVRGMLIYCIL